MACSCVFRVGIPDVGLPGGSASDNGDAGRPAARQLGGGDPGRDLVATHEGTGVARDTLTDVNGEFVLSALPSGPYTVKIEVTGFKTMENRGFSSARGRQCGRRSPSRSYLRGDGDGGG